MSSKKPLDFEKEESKFAESLRFTTGVLQPVPLKALILRYRSGNYKKSENLSASEDGDPLQLIKSYIARGLFDQAEPEIQKLKNAFSDESWLKNELILQELRCAEFKGEWTKALELASVLEQTQHLPSLSRMTFHQVRSNVYYELGEFKRSLNDLRTVEALAIQYSKSPLQLYSKVNEMRILLRMKSVKAGIELETSLWKEWRKTLPLTHLDSLLTLMRARIQVLRNQNLDFAPEAAATLLLSKALDDHLYTGLAWLDFLMTTEPESANWRGDLFPYLEQHPKIEAIYREIESGHPSFETTRSIQEFLKHSRFDSERVTSGAQLRTVLSEIETVMLTDSLARANLKTGKVEALDLQPKSALLLFHLGRGILKKDQLFEIIWGLPFHENRDSVLRTAFSRLREQSGLELQTDGNKVTLSPHSLLIKA